MAEEAAWIKQQRKAFMGWCNGHLADRQLNLNTFEEDFQDGVMLWNLIEIISGKPVKFESKKPKSKIQKVSNLGHVFKFLEGEKLKLVNIGPEDIYNANSKLILGFIWTLILRYQIQKATWGSDVGSASKAKQDLLEWVNAALKASGSSLVAKDFKHSFSDGQIFVALVNYLAPGSVSASGDPITDMNNAFNAAQTFLNIPSLLEAELVNHDPDDLSIMTYVSYFRAKRPDVTAASEPESAKDANEHQVPARVVAEGPGLGSAADWDESEPLGFTIFAEDDQGRRIPLYTIDVSIEGPKDAPHQVTKNDQDLSAHVTYNPQEVGDYKVSVKVNEKEAEGNPFSVHVREAVDQNKVKASGRGTKKAVVGKKAKVAVKVYNKKGKRLDVDEQRIHVAVGDDEAKLEHQLKRSSKGKYKVSYKPEKAGQLSLDVNLDSKSVRGSPFTVTVKDNEDDLAAADQCTLLGPLGHAQINVPKSFKIKAKNNKGGKVVGEEFDVEITGPNGEPVDDVTVTDNEDGTYTVTFTPTALGDHKVEIELDDDQVKGSPFVTVVTENPVTDGVPNGAKSRAYGPGIESPEEGAVTQFTVEPRDENDNVVPSGVDVDVKINGPNGEIPVTVTENEDGTHTVSYTPEQAGEIQVSVSVDGQPLAYSPFPIEVRDSVDRSKTKAQGRGLKKASVGKDAKFYLKTYNKKGKRTDVEMGNFEVKVTGNDEELENQGSQVGKGKYLCSYVPTQVGNVNVVINYENQPVKNSPFSVKVSENSDDFADASSTLASGPGLVAAQVNVPATFKIFAKTSNGQKAVGEEFDVEVVGPNGEPIDDVTVTDNEDGSYTVQYTPTEVGDNIVSVTLNCDDVKGSPATVKVSEDAVSASGPDAAQSKAYGPGLKHPYAGVPTQFTVEPKDENGNNIPYPVDVDVQVTGPDGQVVSSQVSEPSDDGKVEVAYNPEQVGDHKVVVAVNGEPIAKSPVTVAVRPAFDAKNSSASGPGLEKPVEDKPTQFQVKLADANGNPLANGGYTVAPRFDGPDHPEAQVTDNQDGTFDVVYTPVKPGHYKVDVLVDDQPIGSSPYPVEVLCSADPAQCTASGPGLEKATQYEPAHFTIQSKDKSGNNMNVGGNDFTIEVKGDNDSVNADIKDNNDGTYTVSYTPESDGDHKVSVVLDEKPIAGSPFSVPVAGPVADATNSSAKGDGLKKAFTTKSNKFEVSIKDKKGKPVHNDSSNVEVTVDGPEGSIEASVEKKKKGKHQVKYQPSQAGDLTVNVKVNGEPVKNSPFAVKCVEGPDRSKLKVAGKGLSTAFTTRSANFNVDAQDKNGEPINDPELFEVSIAPLNEDGSVGAAPEKENPYNISIEHGKKGSHEVSYQLDKVGKYQLNVTHGDDHLAESPYTVVCKNGSRPEKSVVSKWSFTITAKTEEGEIVDDDEDNFEVNIEGPVELTAKVKALGKGKYRVTYSPSAEGQYKIHITLAGSPIKGSPFIQSF